MARRNLKQCGLTPGVAVLGVVLAVTGRAAEPADSPAESNASESGGLEEIVVHAQRREERGRDVPISITVQSGADLEKQNIIESRDLVAVVPGLAFTYYGSWAQPTIRGITGVSVEPGVDAAVPIYVDGIYHPNQVSNTFTLPDVTNIEVLKGPQGVLFGRNATGGAILVNTQQPSFDFRGTFESSYGHYTEGGKGNDFLQKAFITGPVSQTVALSLAAMDQESTGYFHDVVDDARWGKVGTWEVRSKMLIEPNDALDITLQAYKIHRLDRSAQVFQLANDNNTIGRRLAPDAPAPQSPWDTAFSRPFGVPLTTIDEYGGSVHINAHLGWATLSSTTGYFTSQSDIFGTVIGWDLPIGTSNNHSSDTPLQQEFLLTSPGEGRLTWVTGIFYYSDHAILTNPVTGIYSYVDTKAGAPFGNLDYKITDQLTFSAGARYSIERKAAFSGQFPNLVQTIPRQYFPFPSNIPPVGVPTTWYKVTPRASLRYAVTPESNVYFTYSKGFRSGAFAPGSFQATPAQPENIDSYELGFKAATGNFTISAAAFWYNWKNLQETELAYSAGSSGFQTQLQNGADATVRGFELDAAWRMTSSFTGHVTASLLPTARYDRYPGAIVYQILPGNPGGNTQLTIDASGKRLIRAPKYTFGVGGDYSTQIAGGEFDAAANLYYSSGYNWEVTGQMKAPVYATLDTHLSWTLPATPLTLSLWGKNLTNRPYQVMGLPTVVSDSVQYGPPREVGISALFKF